MLAEWVIGKYTGRQARAVESEAGYIILDKAGKGDNVMVVAAFLRACDRPRPDHLEKVVDPMKIQRFNEIRMNN